MKFATAATAALAVATQPALAALGFVDSTVPDCNDIGVSHSELVAQLKLATAPSSGLNFEMWATIVDRDGVVCNVAFSGDDRGAQWPGSRVISAQKANTANAFSLDGFAISSGNLYGTVLEQGSLYGLQASNPVNAEAAYGTSRFDTRNYGARFDPMVGERVGGVNVFGGGLALYKDCKIVGAVGVSGDTSCTDHSVAWRLRKGLQLDDMVCGDNAVGGPSGDATRPDDLIFVDSVTPGNFEHPNNCIGFDASQPFNNLGEIAPVGSS